MNANKLHVKVFAQSSPKPEQFVPVFHRFIRDKLLDELAIDVADYDHVQEGPGVVLVGRVSDYYWDLGEGRPGLVYSRKREAPAPDARLADAVRRALVGCRLLLEDPTLTGLTFKTDELLVRLPDRLNAPPDDAGFAAFRAELAPLAEKLFGGGVKLERVGGARDMLGARVTASTSASVAELLARVS